MAYSTPRTWVTGELVTAAYLNANVRDNVSFLANPPSCNVHKAVGQSINNDTLTALLYDTEDHDTDNMHSTVTNTSRITINTAGIYIVTAQAAWGTNVTGYRYAGMLVNGATYVAQDSKTSATVATDVGHSLSYQAKFAVNDYIEVQVRQTSGGALSIATSQRFAATWIGLG